MRIDLRCPLYCFSGVDCMLVLCTCLEYSSCMMYGCIVEGVEYCVHVVLRCMLYLIMVYFLRVVLGGDWDVASCVICSVSWRTALWCCGVDGGVSVLCSQIKSAL